MNIRHRIVALVLLTLTAIAGIGGYSVLLSNRNAAEVKRVTEGIVPSALASGDLVSHLKDVQLATIAVVTAPDENLAKQSAGKLSGQIKTLQDALELQLKSASSEAQKGLVTQAKESAANYVAAINDTVKFKLAGQKEMAEANLYAGVAMYQEEIGQIVDTLRIEKGRAKDEAFLNLNQNLAGAVNAILLLTVLAVLILGGVGVLLYRQVIHPIGRMQQMMSDIATHQDF
ncbi:MAG TPA: MCP four helix bundle domain-containing protein, partial [Rhodocyclaceae bacterium]